MAGERARAQLNIRGCSSSPVTPESGCIMLVILRSMALFILYSRKVIQMLWMHLARTLFRECGANVRFGPGCDFAFRNIVIGSDVWIGPGARFNATHSVIRIGNKVLFGPDVSIIGGNHRTDVLGDYMHDVTEKRPEDDEDVIIEDDVWVGCGATILKGVRIGKGSIVGARSVVTSSIPPYCVYVGFPPGRLWRRWTEEQVQIHEALLAQKLEATADCRQGQL